MTIRSEEAKAELKEAEQKLADAKAELKEAEAKLASAEAKQEQVEQKLMETQQADPANTAEIQRLEQKLQTLSGDVAVLRKAFYSKSASVESKEEVIRRLESQLPVIAGPALASSGGEMKMHSSAEQTQTAA
jgi:chromosome segregation ATPase